MVLCRDVGLVQCGMEKFQKEGDEARVSGIECVRVCSLMCVFVCAYVCMFMFACMRVSVCAYVCVYVCAGRLQ